MPQNLNWPVKDRWLHRRKWYSDTTTWKCYSNCFWWGLRRRRWNNNLLGPLLRAPAYIDQNGYDAKSDSDGPSYAPNNDSLDEEITSTSIAQQPPPSKRDKKFSQMEKVDLTAQPVAGSYRTTKRFLHWNGNSWTFLNFLMTRSLNSLSCTPTYALRVRM